jgi:hypothetical protein
VVNRRVNFGVKVVEFIQLKKRKGYNGNNTTMHRGIVALIMCSPYEINNNNHLWSNSYTVSLNGDDIYIFL